jgi:soluble lytic murein transglycosylase
MKVNLPTWRNPKALIVILLTLTLACNLPGKTQLSSSGPSTQGTQQPKFLQETAQSTATPTLPPTPTPLPSVHVHTGDQALLDGDWENALAEYQAAYQSSIEPDTQAVALLDVGRAQQMNGDAEQAASTFEKLIQDYPQSTTLPYAYFNLARAYTAVERYSEAADAYLNYLAIRPGVVDGYILNLRGDALQAANRFPEATSDYRAALQAPNFLAVTDINIKIAHTHALAGDYQTAIALYEDIYNNTTSDFTKAQMDLYIGQAYTSLGQMDIAYTAYQDAVTNYPTSYDTYQALLALVNDNVPVNDLYRGIVDYYAGQYGVALAAFDRYFQSNPAEPATARYYNGLTLRALGGYKDAIKEWDKIIHNFPDDRFWDNAWEQKAYTQWGYMDNYSDAIKTLLDFVSTAPNNSRAGEFLYDAASVAERDGQLEKAAELWQRDFQDYPGYEKATRALLLSGVSYYRNENYDKAYTAFRSLLANASTLTDRSAAYLWQGKAQVAMGDTEAAKATWELGANTDPTGYYSERSRDILRGLNPFTPPQAYDLAFDINSEKTQANEWMKTTFDLQDAGDLSSPGPLQNDTRFIRGSELWQLGLYEEARMEFEDLRKSLENDPANSYRLANYLRDLGLYRSAILASRQVLNLAGMDDASSMNAPIYFNHLRFGPYYAELIVPTAEKYNFDPLFLLSLVRQESAFEGFVRSSAGARGLMQIVPATGEEIATDLKWPPNYSDDDLYRPMVSIVLGSDYLANWRDRLGGDLYAALAAYNGGPGNSTEWQKLANGDPDVFLEVINFEETRNYIRGVYENYNLYRRIYNRSP